MSFDEQPDGDPHGECAEEIARLEAENARLIAELNTALQQVKTEQRLSFRDQVADLEQQRDELSKLCDFNQVTMEQLLQQRDELLAALKDMDRAYMNLLENGRDRILFLGGDCDDIPVMEAGDPYLRQARAAIAKVKP